MLRQALRGLPAGRLAVPAFRPVLARDDALAEPGDAFTVVALSWVVASASRAPVQLGLVLDVLSGCPGWRARRWAGTCSTGFSARPATGRRQTRPRGFLLNRRRGTGPCCGQHRLDCRRSVRGFAGRLRACCPRWTEVAEAALVPRLVADDHPRCGPTRCFRPTGRWPASRRSRRGGPDRGYRRRAHSPCCWTAASFVVYGRDLPQTCRPGRLRARDVPAAGPP